MATYFLSPSGNDSNNGSTIQTAWSSFAKVLGTNGILSGDVVYIKPGIYTQGLTTSPLTAPTSETRLIGDVNGEYFGIQGLVVVNGYSDISTSLGQNLFSITKPFLRFENINFYGGQTLITLSSASTSCTFYKCSFVSGLNTNNGTGISMGVTSFMNLLIDSCFFNCKANNLFINATRTATAYDVGIKIQNSYFMNVAVNYQHNLSGTGTSPGSGLIFINNTVEIANNSNAIVFNNPGTTTIKHKIFNNLFCNASGTAIINGSGNNIFTTNFNKFCNVNTLFTAGTHTLGTSDISGGDSGTLDHFNTYSLDIFGMPFDTSITNILGRGSSNPDETVTAPTLDILGNIRPNPPSIGCFERFPAFKFKSSSGFINSLRGWNLQNPNSTATSIILSSGFVNSLRGWNQIRG